MRKFLTAVSIALFLCFANGSREARAFLGDALDLPPQDNYQVTETSHFKIVYPKRYQDEANTSADVLEQAYSILTKAFQYSPAQKCTVILTDNSDHANGVTSAVGLQGLVLYLTLPDPYSSIGEYDHWLRNLVIHEYAHYVTLEQTRGIFEFARYLFGDLVFPNHLWPSWLAEGLAVYAETTFSQGGRGHGTYYSTLTRSAAMHRETKAREFLDFNQIMGPVPDYPFGEAFYYAGYGIIDELFYRYGTDAPARFPEESSWRIPFFLNSTLHKIDANARADRFQDLWSSWIARQAKILSPELTWLKDHGAPDPRAVSPEGASALGSRISPDGTKLAYNFSSGHERPAVYIYDLARGRADRIEDAIAGAGFGWSGDGAKLYYSKTDYLGAFDFYSDLYVYDLARDSVSRVTRGERAKDPDYCAPSHGAPFLVYSTQRAASSELRAVDIATGVVRVLYRSEPNHHISNPRCAPNARAVYFAEHGTKIFDAIHKLALSDDGATAGTKPERVIGGAADKFGALFPEPLADGSLYFTRAVDGYYDLARFDAQSGNVKLVARSSGGYWLPSVARDEQGSSLSGKVAVTYLTSQGIRASLIDGAGTLEAKFSALKAEPPVANAGPVRQVDYPSQNAPEIPVASKSEPGSYHLVSSLAPRIWSPYLALGETQSQYGGVVLGWDDIDQLEYSLFLWYDTIAKGAEGIFSTYLRLSTFKLGLSASSQVSSYLVNSNGTRTFDTERKLTFSISRPIPGAFLHITPTVLGEWARIYRDGDFSHRIYSPEQRIGAELAIDTLRSYPYSITNEQGTALSLKGRRFFSGPEGAWKGLASLEQILPVLPRHSSLQLIGTFAVAPNPSNDLPQSYVRVGGAGTASDLDPPLPGYPLGNFVTRRAGILSAEYRLPVAELFRGFGTFPLFLRNLGVFGFFDSAKLQRSSGGYSSWISSTGGGLIFNTQLFYSVPVHARLQFSHGLRADLNGENVVSVGFGI